MSRLPPGSATFRSTPPPSASTSRLRAAFFCAAAGGPLRLSPRGVARVQGPVSRGDGARRGGRRLSRRPRTNRVAGAPASGGARLCDRDDAPHHAPDAGRVLAPAPARGQRRRTDADAGAERAAPDQAVAPGSRLRPRDLRAIAASAPPFEPAVAAHPGTGDSSRPEPRDRPIARPGRTALRSRHAARAPAGGVFELTDSDRERFGTAPRKSPGWPPQPSKGLP